MYRNFLIKLKRVTYDPNSISKQLGNKNNNKKGNFEIRTLNLLSNFFSLPKLCYGIVFLKQNNLAIYF